MVCEWFVKKSAGAAQNLWKTSRKLDFNGFRVRTSKLRNAFSFSKSCWILLLLSIILLVFRIDGIVIG